VKFDKFFSGNAELANVDLAQLLPIFQIHNVGGKANIAASISTFADRKDFFTKELTSSVKINAASVAVEGFGLADLVKKMFNIKANYNELRTPEKIYENADATTVFKQISGLAEIEKGRDSKFKLDATGSALNGVISGNFNLYQKQASGLANFIFLTGNKNKQIPINVATAFTGKFGNLQTNTNLDQALQYLGLQNRNPSPNPIATTQQDPQPTNPVATESNSATSRDAQGQFMQVPSQLELQEMMRNAARENSPQQ